MRKTTFFAVLALLWISCSDKKDGNWEELFDGKSLTGWTKLGGAGEFKVEDGAIIGTTVIDTTATFLCTDKEYKDFVLELEVKIADEGFNSGILFRGQLGSESKNEKTKGYRYELDPSAKGWTGGIYDEGKKSWLYPVELNLAGKSAFRPGEYNKIRIECIGNTIKTWVNEFAVAQVIDSGRQEGCIALELSAIGNNDKLSGEKISWKNIKIMTQNLQPTSFPTDVYVVNNIPNTLSASEKEAGWKLLFDGSTSEGWIGAYKTEFPARGWEIKNGVLKVLSSEGEEASNGGDIVTKDEFSSFDLSFEFKLTPGANSGVKYFVTLSEHNTGSAIGLEYQLLDDSLHPDAKMGRDGNRTLASLYDLIKAEKDPAFIHPPGEWNLGRIVVYPDNRVEHYLNGIKVLEYTRGSSEYRDLVAQSKYKVWQDFGEASKGHILLQDHGNEVSFRSIKIRELK